MIRLSGRHAVVEVEGARRRCALRGHLFRDLAGFTKPVAVGDRVLVERAERGWAVSAVQPREAWLSRRVAESDKEQIIIANVEMVVVVDAVAEPPFRPRFTDRVLVAAERGGFEGLILMNKVDLIQDRSPFEDYAALYRSLGYGVCFTSTLTGEGLPEVRERLRDKISVFTGHSGVGKSTLLNAVQPGLGLQAREVSRKGQRGRHTTTAVSLLQLEIGGYVADTPGLRSFAIAGLEPSDIAIFFPDLAPFVDDCRFSGCTHDHEPECAVMAAAERGEIDPRRFESYLRILHGLDEEPE